MSKIIEIIASPQSETQLETKGFQGLECQEASKFVEAALGQRAGETLTAEFHEVSLRHEVFRDHTGSQEN